jgi:hypothetical protein
VTAQGLASQSDSAAISRRQLRDALHALVGLRLSLFPATLAPAAPPAQEPAR